MCGGQDKYDVRIREKPVVADQPSEKYRRYVLGLLAVVYAFNFIDRNIISVLATDLKRDLGLTDADLGFMYGTAFGVFYALFGIPMGRLADSWHRVRLITIGLSLWSLLTAVSGLARNGLQLSLARIGVGVGEATASPCAYSLLSDYFPRERRATALGIYSSGMFIGSGVSLLLGATVVERWNRAFPDGYLGLVGWQAAFMVIGLPGLLLAILVSTVREPVRGMADGLYSPPVAHPFKGFFEELLTIIPPFTLVGAAQGGARSLLMNVVGALLIAAGAYGLILVTGSALQWSALGIGVYAVFSWAMALRRRDPAAFALTWGTPTFVLLIVGYGLTAILNYALAFWALPYAETALGATKSTAGLIIGGSGAAGGFLGLMIGGRIADRLRAGNPVGRIIVILIGAFAPLPLVIISYTTTSLPLFYALVLPQMILAQLGLGAVAATAQDLVLPRMRGLATAVQFISITLIGLALGPYTAGQISTLTGSLGTGVLSLMAVVPLYAVALLMVYRRLPQAEATLVARAQAAGEPVDPARQA